MILIYSALALSILIHVAFIVGTTLKNNGVMDSFYPIGFIVLAWTSFLLIGEFNLHNIIITILVTIWGVRLAIHVTNRNWGKPEDKRYRKMRERFGDHVVLKSYVKIYLFQGLLIFLIGFSVLFINISPQPSLDFINWPTFTMIIGLFIWCSGFYFEAVGDYQLAHFLKQPENQGKIMDDGLWKYTQHPNYFGEVTQWWGIWGIATGVNYPWGFLMVFSPIILNYMIIKISGVKLLNKRFEGDDEYAEYKKRTSSFIPWFPKEKEK